jgi:hypothetical protein
MQLFLMMSYVILYPWRMPVLPDLVPLLHRQSNLLLLLFPCDNVRPFQISSAAWPEKILYKKLLTLTDTMCLMSSQPLMSPHVEMPMITALI